MEGITHADTCVILRKQFRRRHPEWFDPRFYRPLTLKERRARRLRTEEERIARIMGAAKKAQ